ncbi:MAG: type II toxin-antitoxin system RelE/ParE family toxin [Propionibacteriaceae bacterium]|nr:type II toxin-antitoxin system RelE/ParE family toxin [Propionibacteriaceae bacterium]
MPSASARLDFARLLSKIAAAVFEFIDGPLRSNPYRLSKPLRGPLAGCQSARRGEYRVIFRINEARKTLEILHVMHRRDAYRLP